MKVILNNLKTAKKADTLVLFITKDESLKKFGYLECYRSNEELTGKKDEVFFLRGQSEQGFFNTLVIGLGEKKDLNRESYRRAGGIAFNQLQMTSASAAAIDVDFSIKTSSAKSKETFMQALAEGMHLANYKFDDLKKKDEKDAKNGKKPIEVQLLTSEFKAKAFLNSINVAETLADATKWGRKLGDLPGNLMTPSILADEVKKAFKGLNTKITVWDRSKIKSEKMGGLLGVSLGSSQEPRFIIIEYKGASSQKKKPIVLVGKGLTFDSGGISIKPAQSMDEMKYDMCGGANVLAAALAVAKLKLKVNLTVMVPATENMTGPSANKPGDILTARNGLTMEVLNTDAEGRLILADALAYASELKPQVILDAATLTGAIIIALGNSYTGVFTRNNDLWKKIESSAEKTDEPIWRMPLNDHHVQDIKSDFADVANISSFRGAGSSTAAAFLEKFVDSDIPWAHFDIAGTAWNCSNRQPYVPKKGATGAMIRTFVQFVQDHF